MAHQEQVVRDRAAYDAENEKTLRNIRGQLAQARQQDQGDGSDRIAQLEKNESMWIELTSGAQTRNIQQENRDKLVDLKDRVNRLDSYIRNSRDTVRKNKCAIAAL